MFYKTPITLYVILTHNENVASSEAQNIFLDELKEKYGPVTLAHAEIVEGGIGKEEVPYQPRPKQPQEYKQQWIQQRAGKLVQHHRHKAMTKAVAPGLVPKKMPIKGLRGTYYATRYVAPDFSGGVKLYLKEIAKYPVLSTDEEKELTRKYKTTHDPESANKLITSNLKLVARIAIREFSGKGVRLGDLLQEGNYALTEALQKFDPERGAKFSTFAASYARGYMQNLVTKQVTAASRHEELPEESEVEVEHPKPGLASDVPTAEETMEFEQEMSSQKARIEQALATLNPTELLIVQRHMTEVGEKKKTLKQLGKELGMSDVRVNQIEQEAKRKLRAILGQHMEKALKEYFDTLRKAGDSQCPYDRLSGIQLRRFKQGPFWIREFRCPKGHVWQRTQ